MTSQASTLSQRVEKAQRAIEQFPAAAASLNNATDQLGKAIAELDAVLKRFSLGVPTWIAFSSWEHYNNYSSDEIGYSKIGGKWGIAIRTIEGNHQDPEGDEIEQWIFNDAPRLLRVEAVSKIPELLEELLKKAAQMTNRIVEKAAEVDALAAGINAVIEAPSKQKPPKR